VDGQYSNGGKEEDENEEEANLPPSSVADLHVIKLVKSVINFQIVKEF
jgi:hypothetical protein